jgi:hypothetical protein
MEDVPMAQGLPAEVDQPQQPALVCQRREMGIFDNVQVTGKHAMLLAGWQMMKEW